MNAEQKMVRDFNEKHLIPYDTRPIVPHSEDLIFRIRLMHEELSEFIAAANKEDLVDMADALGDLLYVTYGTALTLGLDMEPIFNDIHRSNMTKSIFKDAGGKVEKDPNWKPPKIAEIINASQNPN